MYSLGLRAVSFHLMASASNLKHFTPTLDIVSYFLFAIYLCCRD